MNLWQRVKCFLCRGDGVQPSNDIRIKACEACHGTGKMLVELKVRQ